VNPFDLYGPSFLLFYWVVVGAGLAVIAWLRARADVTGDPTRVSADPYLLAYLRGGHPEVVCVALLLLIEDGIVQVKGRDLTLAPDPGRPDRRSGRPAIERELIACLGTGPKTVDQIVDAGVGLDACVAHRAELEELGYLSRRAQLDFIRSAGIAFAVLFVTIAAIKIHVALNRGRSNFGFLLISACVAFALAIKAGVPVKTITTRGERGLRGTEALLAGAKDRLKHAGAALSGQELAWLAATYGFSIFYQSPLSFEFWPALHLGNRPDSPHGASSNGSTFGSSYGSSIYSCSGGGSSCGGGCGGGGCGGCGG
jgi:uncharacterized protein (TIGR04222 family)